jgi:hypothetical protein
MPFPLAQQGEQLADDFGYAGQWILKPRLFLFTTDVEKGDPSAPQFTTYKNYGRDDWMVGFDARIIAVAIGITKDEILEANRTRQLTLERTEEGIMDDGSPAKRYTFRVGDREGPVIIACPVRTGTA